MHTSPSDEEITILFPASLLSWDREHNRRSMPWKGEKNPYKIWLSEVILQQTRVEQGLSYYEKFIKAYPTVLELANAPEEEVYAMWEGLGYYSRCRNLISAAREIAFQRKGVFPSGFEEILELKGVGPYTAAAIASFAFNLPHAVLDGNVARVLSRIYLYESPVDSTEGRKFLVEKAQDLLPEKEAGRYNQAIMDFGATICKPVPLCTECFFNETCRARRAGREKELPVKLPKKASRERWFNYIVLKAGNEFLVRQRTAKDIWQNLHEFFLIETPGPAKPHSILNNIEEDVEILATSSVKQKLSHQTIHFQFILASITHKKEFEGYSWKKREDLEGLAFPQTLKVYLRSDSAGAKFDYD